MEFNFKNENTVEQRKQNCIKLREKFPDKIPIICEKDPNSKTLKDIDKTKYLISSDLTVAQFNFMIRRRIEIKQEESFFLLVNGKNSLTTEMNLGEVYKKYADPEDGFLYIAYASALTWGKN